MSVDFFKTPIVKLLDDRQTDVLKGNDVCVCRAQDKRMIPLVFQAVYRSCVIRVCPSNDHAGDAQDVELQPCCIEPRNYFSRGDEDLLPLMTTNLATRSLIFDVNGADLVFDKLLDQIANMMLASMSGVAVGNDHRRTEFDSRGLFPLRRGHSHPIGPLCFV